jgi:hypothetical protein
MFAIMFDQYGYINYNDSGFTYSNVQLYQTSQSSCNPNDAGVNYYPTSKFSTSPLPFNNPATTIGSPSSDTFSVQIDYNGSDVAMCTYDVTAANGSCSSGSAGTGVYYQNTWHNVSIPGMVGSTMATPGFASGIGTTVAYNMDIKSWVYTVNTATAYPGTTAMASGGTPTATPTFSPAAGSYSGTQTVTISDSTSGSNICYTLGAANLAVPPMVDNYGGCGQGTAYTGPVSVSSSQTLYASAGTNTLSSGQNLASGLAQGVYTISGSASTPTFSPTAGTYTGSQNVAISSSSGSAIICYNTTGSPATNGSTGCTTGTLYTGLVSVSSSETLYAVAGGTGYTDSSVGSAAYVINAGTGNPTMLGGNEILGGNQVITH